MALTVSQYNEIMRGYERRRLSHQHELQSHISKIYEQIPRLEEINHLISSMSVSIAKDMLLNGDSSDVKDARRQLSALKDEKASLIKNSGYPSDYLEISYDCPDCKDTGYMPDGLKCHCLRKQEIDILYSQSNIKDIIEQENFSTFSYKFYSDNYIDPVTEKSALVNMRNVVAICKDYIRNFSKQFTNIFIYGATGVGKTFLTNCIAKELMDQEYSVIYLSAVQLFDILADESFGRDQTSHRTDDIMQCDLLIVDDLGTELNNSFTTSSLFNCMNERLLSKHSTIISSNLSFNEIQDTYSDRLFSRILGNYKILKIYGDDIRLKKRN